MKRQAGLSIFVTVTTVIVFSVLFFRPDPPDGDARAVVDGPRGERTKERP